MNINIKGIKARIKRNKLEELAGDNFRDFDSKMVKSLRDRGYSPILGIENSFGEYTVLGEECLYFGDSESYQNQIVYVEILSILSKNAKDLGKQGNFEYIELGNKKRIWMKDGRTMNAMWNTILMLADR